MNAIEARANADALRIKALALYAEAKALRDGPSWRESVQRALIAKIAEAKAVDDAFNNADVIAMRLRAEELWRKSRAA
jgi:hypothetical protein